MRSPLLERKEELGALADLRRRACDGQGGLVLVQASAGLGKSSLLAACTAGARAEGMAVLGAGGSELEQGFAFGACRRLFEARVAAAAPQERGELLEGAAAGCAPAIAPPAPAPGPAAEEQLFPILHGLFWLTSNLADREPLLLALDDAHWADRASLRFLLYLAERVEDLAVALVVCVREGEPTGVGDLLDRLRADPSVTVARPAPLTHRGVDALVRRRLPGAVPALGEAIARSTAGNPLFVTELVGELAREDIEPDARAAAGIEGRAPQAVLPALLARVARLGEGAVALARSAALLGDDATLAQAAQLARLERDPAVRAADALAGAGILAGGEPLAFTHPLIRHALHADHPAAARAEAHRLAARLLADHGEPVERAASHLLQAGRTGDVWAVGCLREAADGATGRGVPDAAVAYLERALDEPPAPEQRGALLVALGRAEYAAGLEGAMAHVRAGLDLEADPRRRREGWLALGWQLHDASRPAEAAQALEQGLAELDEGRDDDLRFELEVALRGARLLLGVRDDEPVLERLLGDVRSEVGTPRARAVLVARGIQRASGGRPCAEVLPDAHAGLEQEGPDAVGDASIWPVHAVGLLLWCDELECAEAELEALLERARRRRAPLQVANLLYHRAWPAYWRGRVDEALSDAQAAVDAWDGEWGGFLGIALYWLALAHLERGELDAAGAALDLSGREQRWQDTYMWAVWRVGRGRVALARGEYREALDELTDVGERLDALGLSFLGIAPWHGPAALAAAALGEQETARRLAGRELGMARTFANPRALGGALRASGLVEGGTRGVELLGEAVAVLESSPAALERARALIDLGALLRSAGRRREARDALHRGLALCEGFSGAVVLTARAREELLAAGGRPRREAVGGQGALTPSERRVAQLAAAGQGNRQIAQELFVTRRTVETHLTHVYAKLDIASREQIAAALG